MAKGITQLEKEADTCRKKGVDAKNRKDAVKDKVDTDKMANTPLTSVEQAFVVKIAAKMNCGRHSEMPVAADILKYSKLKNRMSIPEKGNNE